MKILGGVVKEHKVSVGEFGALIVALYVICTLSSEVK